MCLLTNLNQRLLDDNLIVDLIDGRSLIVPLSWYPRLLKASQEERENWQLLGEGYAISWIDLDEHIDIEGLLAGKQSAESHHFLERCLATRSHSSQRELANEDRILVVPAFPMKKRKS